MKLYENIKKLRIQKGLSQEELAALTGYTNRTSIGKIEQGKVDLSQSKIKVFAKALDTDPVTLMGLDESDNQSYYSDPQVAKYAEELRQNSDMRLLFDVAHDISKEDLELVVNIIKDLKKRNK
ncbi:helix-turn-helix transcriptional regulator [Veillonella sp.]|uniref:helix-turn-helix domain-containing protein n=1 Tax=Veillonella sp. TaxID=1926307 RepID=UPI0025F0E404|nr:helix-turn-helix transcriptional regulator [Veillonella sp.]